MSDRRFPVGSCVLAGVSARRLGVVRDHGRDGAGIYTSVEHDDGKVERYHRSQIYPAPDLSDRGGERSWSMLTIADRGNLLALAYRSRPSAGADLERLERFGLVAFVRETRGGTTWFRATEEGKRLVRGAIERGDAQKMTVMWSLTFGRKEKR